MAGKPPVSVIEGTDDVAGLHDHGFCPFAAVTRRGFPGGSDDLRPRCAARHTIANDWVTPRWLVSTQRVSGEPGAVHRRPSDCALRG